MTDFSPQRPAVPDVKGALSESLPETGTPVENFRPLLTSPSRHAAGAKAVYHALKYGAKQAGIFRTTKSLLQLNQKAGFDCPSCAWPDPDDRRALAEFCENGAKAVADETTVRRITTEFFKTHSLHALSRQSDFELGQHGRLTHPMIKRAGSDFYEEITWEDAFEVIATELNTLDSPDRAVFYTSGRTSNEAAFVYQLFVRLFGTNNLPDCSNMCHESSGTGLSESIGVGKATVTLEELHYADCILVIGQNPGTNHPRMLTALQKAVRNGAKIISVNPLKEAGLVQFDNPQEVSGWLGLGTPLACLHLPVRLNGDVALLKGIMKELLRAEREGGPGSVFDLEFISTYTEGFDLLIDDIERAEWGDILNESGLSREQIFAAAEIILKAKKMIVCWAMGITQHKNGVANVQSIVNLLLLGGHMGRASAGVCPVRGHSNVQGDRTMGIFEKMPDAFLNKLEEEFGFQPPRAHGLHTIASIKAMEAGRVKVFFGLGGNFFSAAPDTERVARSFRRCRLTVQVSTKLNRGHLITGEVAMILPCLGRTEIDVQASGAQFVTVEDTMGKVHASRGNLRPGSNFLKSEVAIIAGLAQVVFKSRPEKRDKVRWSDLEANYDLIRDHISRVVPGFERFNERAKTINGFYLPNGVKDSRTFHTKTGKARFTVHPIAKTTPPQGRYLLMTIRSHDQFNTTIYGLDDRYRGIKKGRRVVLMNRQDIALAGLREGGYVNLTSHFKGLEGPEELRKAAHFMVVGYEIPQRCLAVYYPEGNVLVPINHYSDLSMQPASKSIEVSLEPAR